MISAFAKNGNREKAIRLFKLLQKQDYIKSDIYTYTSMLKTCADIGDIDTERDIHNILTAKKIILTPPVYNSLLFLYTKCGYMTIARRIFEKIQITHGIKDSIPWNTLLSALCKFSLLTKNER